MHCLSLDLAVFISNPFFFLFRFFFFFFPKRTSWPNGCDATGNQCLYSVVYDEPFCFK